MSVAQTVKRTLPIALIICGFALAETPKTKATAEGRKSLLLTKHEDETIENQTIYLNGQAFIRCKFKACTLVLRESEYHLEGCDFERCNFHLDMLVMWGDTSAHMRDLHALLDLIEKAGAATP